MQKDCFYIHNRSSFRKITSLYYEKKEHQSRRTKKRSEYKRKKKPAAVSDRRFILPYEFKFIMPFAEVFKPLADGILKGFTDIFPGSF